MLKLIFMRPEGQKILYNIGVIVGVLGGLIGMAVGIASSPVFGSIFALFFILVFGFVFGGQYLKNKKREKLLETGSRANGKIVEMWDTGVTINNQPQIGMVIEVTPQAGPPFKSEISLVVSRLQTAYYQVGVNCIVKYDPNDKKTVAIESLGSSLGNQDSSSISNNFLNSDFQENPYFPGKSPEQIEEYLKIMDTEVKRILQIGIECKAIIKNNEFTNVYVNGDNTVNSFVVEVLPDNQPAYEAKCIGIISAPSILKFQPGKQVWIKYDPADKYKITLSHS